MSIAPGVIINNKWIHIAVTSNANVNTIYVNGVLNVSGTATQNWTSGTAYIGQVGGGRYYGGIIDDVRLYNRALSAAEIKQLYLIGK